MTTQKRLEYMEELKDNLRKAAGMEFQVEHITFKGKIVEMTGAPKRITRRGIIPKAEIRVFLLKEEPPKTLIDMLGSGEDPDINLGLTMLDSLMDKRLDLDPRMDLSTYPDEPAIYIRLGHIPITDFIIRDFINGG